MTNAVLFVCSMNVCRSPLMQWTFVEALSNLEGSAWTVSSRGVNALKGNAICDTSATLLQGSENARRFAQEHASEPLSSSDLISPALIVTATRAERAALARYAPALRSRTFTLREANLLGIAPPSPREKTLAVEADDTLDEALSPHGFAHLLHRRRGSMALPQPRRKGRPRADPLDIPDAHLSAPHAHEESLRAVHTETRALATRFLHFRDSVTPTL